jgi:FKBP-type peptidyl-prolyl cis-trans isomerase
MKKLLIFTCLILTVLSLHARAIREDIKKADEKIQVSYAFGMAIGSNLITTNLEIDYRAFAEGLKAVMEGKETRFTEQEAMELIEAALQKEMEEKSSMNMIAEQEFLANNRERSTVHVTESGLQYEILTQTEGEKPKANSTVRVYYSGSFVDGTEFDKSGDTGEGAIIPLDRVIPGWSEGLTLMSVGSKYKFYIPSELAYGRDGIQSIIQSYATLIFTVELLEIIVSADEFDEEES